MFNSGRRGKRAPDGVGVISVSDKFLQNEYPTPIINSWSIVDNNNDPIYDDTALDSAGGQKVVIYGSGFRPGATVNINGSNIGTVTFLDQGRLLITSPALSSGTYTIYVSNTNGATAIYVPGLIYSGLPTWSTSAGSIGSFYETRPVSQTFTATGDAPITYSIYSGDLPLGTNLNSSTGELTGTLGAESGSTTYSFTIRATDAQNQDSDRSFTLTVNTDVVTWVTPSQNYVISSYEYAPISNVTANATSAAGYGTLISANALPTGVTLDAKSGLISGTINTIGNTDTLLTATANVTNRTATRDISFNVNQDVVTWSNPANNESYSVFVDTGISPVNLSATSAAGFGVQYTANALPAGLTLSGTSISGTPTTSSTVNTELTATANTTGRSAKRYITWTVSVAGDINLKYTTILLSSNTFSQTQSFVDDTSLNDTQSIQFSGNIDVSNFNPYQHGYYSYELSPVTADHFTLSNIQALGAGNFTVEFWVYSPLNYSGAIGGILESRTSGNGAGLGYVAYATAINTIVWIDNTTTVVSGTVTQSNWNHVAFVRSGTTLTMYVNGISTASATNSTNYNVAFNKIGTTYDGSYFTGYISNIRLIKEALYTGNFTPSKQPLSAVSNTFFLGANSNRFYDLNNPNNIITPVNFARVASAHPFEKVYQSSPSYSLFCGGGAISVPSDATGTVFGTGAFTVEFWYYNPTVSGGNTGYFVYGSGTDQFRLQIVSTTSIRMTASGSTTALTFTVPALQYDIWYHIAYVRDVSGNATLFVNGVRSSTGVLSDTNNYTGYSRYIIPGGSSRYISNVRFIKGENIYDPNSSTITVPTSPLTATTNTTLLLAQTNTQKDNSINDYLVTYFSGGESIPTTFSPFTSNTNSYTTTEILNYGSAYINGTSATTYINAGNKDSIINLDNTNFTIEFWAYHTSFNSSGTTTPIGVWGSSSRGWRFYYNSTQNAVYFSFTTDGSTEITVGGVLSFTYVRGQWYHWCATRVGATIYLLLNGYPVGTYSIGTSSIFKSTQPLYIGANKQSTDGGSFGDSMIGYISDVRIVKGNGLYPSGNTTTASAANTLPQITSPFTAVANTTLLTLQSNVSNNNAKFKNESYASSNTLIIRSNNVTNGTFSPYGDNWSAYFDGTGDYLTVPSSSSTDISSGDFTVEFWFNVNSVTGDISQYFIDSYFNGVNKYMIYSFNNTLYAQWLSGGVGKNINTTITANTWNHVAFVRSGNVFTLYLNGTSVGTPVTDSNTLTAGSSAITIGQSGASSGPVNGYISNVRILKGTALYTSTFAPSLTPLTAIANTALLTCNTNRFIDSSPNNFVITRSGDTTVSKFSPFANITVSKYYSQYFTGSTNYLTLAGAGSPMSLTGDFTVEFWLYPTTLSDGSYYHLVSSGYNGQVLKIFWSSSSGIVYYYNGGSFNFTSNTSMITNGKWHHFAWVRSGSNSRLYINGIGYDTVTSNMGTISWDTAFNVAGASAFENFPGYVSNLRVLKGTALYDITQSTITVPTEPLTAISNTSLLTCHSNLLIDSSNNSYNVASVGNSTPLLVSPFTPVANASFNYSTKTFGGSMYFDGAGDSLTIPDGALPELSNQPFTIEAWVYSPTPATALRVIIGKYDSGPFTSVFVLNISTTNNLSVTLYHSSASNFGIVGPTVPVKQWFHVAVTRDRLNVFRLFLNGLIVGTTPTNINALNDNSLPWRIGARSDNNAVFPFIGYLSDVRITHGAALYTKGFYPGSQPLTPIAYSNNRTDLANTGYSTLLLSGTSGGIIDSSRNNNFETFGNTSIRTTSPYNEGYYSVQNGDSTDSSAVWSISAGSPLSLTGDYTVEFWLNLDRADVSYMQVLNSSGGNGNALKLEFISNAARFYFYNGSSYTYSSYKLRSGKWYHIVWERSGTTSRMYIDGVGETALTNMTATVDWSTLYIGSGSTSEQLFGQISNLRVIKGTCLYDINSSTLTVPTSPLTAVSGTQLLTCQSNKFVDLGPNNYTITTSGVTKVLSSNPFKANNEKSYYFDGSTGNYITTPYKPEIHDWWKGDYTIEAWVYPRTLTGWSVTNTNNLPCMIQNGAYNGTTSYWSFGPLNNGTVRFYYSTGSQQVVTSTETVKVNQWNHIAITNSSSTIKIWVNGVGTTGTSITGTPQSSNTQPLVIGAYYNSYINGYVSDLRITNGVARYTTNFTPTTTPFLTK